MFLPADKGEHILLIHWSETGLQSASVKRRVSLDAAFMPSVRAYFLLPQNASTDLTFTILIRLSPFSKCSIVLSVSSEEPSLIKTISKSVYCCDKIEGKKRLRFRASFLAQIITETLGCSLFMALVFDEGNLPKIKIK